MVKGTRTTQGPRRGALTVRRTPPLLLVATIALVSGISCGSRTEFANGADILGVPSADASATATTSPDCVDATLGTDALGAGGLAIDGADVYWTTRDGKVMKSTHDSPGVPLATGLTSPNGITVFGDNVFWTEETRVMSMPKSGGAMSVIADSQSLPMVVVVDATGVWWLNRGDGILAGSLVKSIGGGATQIVADQIDTPADLAMDGPSLYFSATLAAVNDKIVMGPLVSIAKQSGAPTLLWQDLHEPAGIVADATSLFWLEQVNDTFSFPGRLRVVPKGGGTPTDVASTANVLPIRFALDQSYAYMTGLEGTGTDSHGVLWRIARSGGTVNELVRTNGVVYESVVNASTAIYFTIGWSAGTQPAGAPSVRKICKRP